MKERFRELEKNLRGKEIDHIVISLLGLSANVMNVFRRSEDCEIITFDYDNGIMILEENLNTVRVFMNEVSTMRFVFYGETNSMTIFIGLNITLIVQFK